MILWEKSDTGWYTSPIGGICRERDGKWHFYPKDSDEVFGPFTTMRIAKQFSGEWSARKTAK